ncbi:chloride channel protein [Legionella adelaidensis]|uniref:chloride channel protein n=1 Tax=Legionella adelaidensis TaxID=45056 RepID=UPI001F3C2971|nr:chloride channel protein [Legionella adelaidensis]
MSIPILGVIVGLIGIVLTYVLHAVQHLAYGYSIHQMISNETFLQGVLNASPLRRLCVLALCGIIASLGWWLLARFASPIVSVAEAVKTRTMPVITTIVHAFLQIITIALGSPLGREAAPREMGALAAIQWEKKIGLSNKQTKILLACAAGGGLAAVYNVPLSGATYVLEVLLLTLSWEAVIPALVISTIAVVVSWIGLGNKPLYYFSTYHINYSLIIWSILTGPFFGAVAYFFIKATTEARKNAPQDKRLLIYPILNFLCIGFLAILFPALLGNGKSPVQLEFDDELTLTLSLILFVLRMIITWSSLRSGSKGGLLTPCLANGALMGVVLGGLWNFLSESNSLNAYALIGSTAFLAAAQKMPITAILLIFELTHIKFSFLVPLLFAVTGSATSFYFLNFYFEKKKKK